MTSQVEGREGSGAGASTFPYDSQSFYNPPISPEFFSTILALKSISL